MSTTVNVSGTNYSVPTIGESNWGENTTALLIQLASSTKVFQTTSSTFSLAQEVDFGATYGIKLAYVKSKAINPSSTGIIRLGNTESIGFRNAANSGDLLLTANASDQLVYNGTALQGAVSVTDSSTIDLTLTGSAISGIVIADSLTDSHINSAAAIAYSKLSLLSSIVNADINASANIDASKLGTGVVSTTEFDYLNGVTSAIQTQIDSKAPIASPTFTGTVSGITKTMVGLGNVDNTSDATKDAATATLSNKTLTSPVINSPTGIVKGDVGLGNVDNVSDLNKPVSTATQTALDLKTSITGGSVISPTRLDFKKDTKANLVTYALTASDGQACYATDTEEYFGIENGLLVEFGGGGSGGINYITNYDLESDATGYTAYADAAGTSPVDGTGGSPSITIARSTSSPLRGSASLLLTKGASNLQGNGFSYDFTIDAADKGKVLQGSFEYQIASGTFADDDITVWIYDVTNSRLIQPAPYKLKNSSLIERYGFEFQAAIDSTSYRLIFHVSSTSASAYTVKMDNFNVGPQAKLYGSPITDWTSYTPTFTGFGTVSGVSAYYSRHGSDLLLRCNFTSGSATTTEARISLPTGLTSVSATGTLELAGSFLRDTNGTSHGGGVLIEASKAYVTFGSPGTYGTASLSSLYKRNGDDLAGAGTIISIEARIPIQGWSSSQVMSSDADTRVVACRAIRNSSNQSIASASATKVAFNATTRDSHGAFDTTNNRFVAPVPGDYVVSAILYLGSVTANEQFVAHIYKNGVNYRNLFVTFNNTGIMVPIQDNLSLVAGDYVEIWIESGGDASYTVNNDANYVTSLSIYKLQGPAQIAASESITAAYSVSANFACSTSTPINYDTKEFDSHNAVTTSASAWKFTAPASGVYQISSFGNVVGGGAAIFYLYKNGSTYKIAGYQPASGVYAGTILVKLLAGEYIDMRPASSISVVGGAINSGLVANINIARIGNY